jgi:hypothetical protein
MLHVMQILKAAVDSQMGFLKQPDPFIRFFGFEIHH